MLLYHSTTEDAATAIMTKGFRNGSGVNHPGLERAVWFSDEPNKYGEATIVVDVPDNVAARHHLEHDEAPHREYVIPAKTVNRYPRRRRCDSPTASVTVSILLTEEDETRAALTLRNNVSDEIERRSLCESVGSGFGMGQADLDFDVEDVAEMLATVARTFDALAPDREYRVSVHPFN